MTSAAAILLPVDAWPCLADLVTWYERTRFPALAADTRKTQRSVLHQAVAALPAEPGPSDLRAWLDRSGLAPSTANKDLAVLRAVYRLAQAELEVRNPTARLSRHRTPRPRPRALSDPSREFPLLLEAGGDIRSRGMLLVMRYQGLRIGEALGLEWDDLESGHLGVRQQRRPWQARPCPLKHRAHAALLPLHPLVASVLSEVARLRRPLRGAGARYFFPFFDADLRRLMIRLRSLVPLPRGDGFHVLRHTYATQLLAAGTELHIISRLLRHASVAETQTYCAQLREGRPVDQQALASAYLREADEATRVATVLTTRNDPLEVAQGGSLAPVNHPANRANRSISGHGGCREPPSPLRGPLTPLAVLWPIRERQVPVDRPGSLTKGNDETRAGDGSRSRGRAEPKAPAPSHYSIDVGWTDHSASTSSTLPLRFPPWSVTPAPPNRRRRRS